MLLAAASLVQPQTEPRIATARAQAVIRIVSAVQLRVGADRSEQGQPVERSTVRAQDGTLQPAMLVQFE